MLVERILLLVRNVLHVPPNQAKEQVSTGNYSCMITHVGKEFPNAIDVLGLGQCE